MLLHRTAAAAFVMMTLAGQAIAQGHRWDVSGGTGGWWGRPERAADPIVKSDDWSGAWLGSVTIGRYWTEHLKTEFDAALTSEATRYAVYTVTIPGDRLPRYYSTEDRHQQRSLAALVVLQAGRNWWVHPFVLAGVSADWDRVRAELIPLVSSGSPTDPGPFPRIDAKNRTVARAVVGVGAKFYLSQTAFFRMDLRSGFGGDGTHVQFRTGFGVDF
jgi:hypothetical protein